MEAINLKKLVSITSIDLPKEFDKLNVIYKITNINNGDSYIGKAKSFRSRFYGGYKRAINKLISPDNNEKLRGALFPAFRLYGIENFEVTILEYDVSPTELNNREIQWISTLDTFKGKGYNCTKGGESGIGGNPWSDLARANSRRTNLDKYSESNGAPTEWTEAGRSALLSIYSSTNGTPPQNTIKAHDALKEYYKDTNGMPPQATKVNKLNHTLRPYNALYSMCTKAESDGVKIFTHQGHYLKYKIDYSPTYSKNDMKRVFRNFREFGFDITLISKFIRKDWQ